MATSELEASLALQIRAIGLPEPKREFTFMPKRRFRFDFAWPEQKLAAECEGGIWTGGRHTRGRGFEDDCLKYSEAALLGWKVLRFTEDHIRSGVALAMIERGLCSSI